MCVCFFARGTLLSFNPKRNFLPYASGRPQVIDFSIFRYSLGGGIPSVLHRAAAVSVLHTRDMPRLFGVYCLWKGSGGGQGSGRGAARCLGPAPRVSVPSRVRFFETPGSPLAPPHACPADNPACVPGMLSPLAVIWFVAGLDGFIQS